MSYTGALQNLRNILEQKSTGRLTTKSDGIVPVKVPVQSLPQDSTEDLLSRSAGWLKSIREAAVENEKKNRTMIQPKGGFLQGYLSTVADKVPTANETSTVQSVTTPDLGDSRMGVNTDPIIPKTPKTITEAIDKYEGGGSYDTLYGHAENSVFSGKKVSEMTIGDLKTFSKGDYAKWVKDKLGYVATPMGKYQFVGKTMADIANRMGLPDDTVFSPKVQDSMYQFKLDETLGKANSIEGQITALRNEWVGLKNVPDDQLAQMIKNYGQG